MHRSVDELFSNYKNDPSSAKVMDILQNENLTPKEVYDFLHRITTDEETSSLFIDEILKDENGNWKPQKSSDIVRVLVRKIGGKPKFDEWYFAAGGYWEAFQRYGKRIYDNATSIEELCAFLPNWGAGRLPQKYDFIKNGNRYNVKIGKGEPEKRTDSFTLGQLPDKFKDIET